MESSGRHSNKTTIAIFWKNLKRSTTVSVCNIIFKAFHVSRGCHTSYKKIKVKQMYANIMTNDVDKYFLKNSNRIAISRKKVLCTIPNDTRCGSMTRNIQLGRLLPSEIFIHFFVFFLVNAIIPLTALTTIA